MWGPDALTANELESNGVPERILVSPIVMEVVKDMPDIRCTFHRKATFTNHGLMDTYLVEFVELDERAKSVVSPPPADLGESGEGGRAPAETVVSGGRGSRALGDEHRPAGGLRADASRDHMRERSPSFRMRVGAAAASVRNLFDSSGAGTADTGGRRSSNSDRTSGRTY